MSAPPLKDVTWVKGEPVATWQPGHVYVLDFWATWCGPCKASIPHIDALADARGKDNVHVIGVAIWPREKMVPTPDFVKEKGDAMSYGICEDVPDPANARSGLTSNTFMMAAGQHGIPTCMVVDKAGKIAWIGHPMNGLEKVVDEVVAGTWDAEAFGKKFIAQQQAEAKSATLQQAYAAARKAGDWNAAAQAAADLFALDPENNAQFAALRYAALVKAEKVEVAAAFGRELAAGPFKDNAMALNGLAWSVVDPTSMPAHPDLELAHLAADKANTLTKGEDFSILDTLARVVYLQGDVAKARELQQKAIDKAPDEAKGELTERLKEYQTASHG